MMEVDLLKRAVYESRDGIVITDATQPTNPLIFVNPAFERMTGYSSSEVIGRNCRFLQADLRDQPALAIVREAIERGEPCIVTLQNFRKDGSLFWNELSLSPIHDSAGRLTHFLGIQKDVSSDKLVQFALREEKEGLRQMHERLIEESLTDALTGLHNRRLFDNSLPDLICRARQDGVGLAIMLVDIDYFKKLNDSAGHLAGDQALRKVADCLKQSRRRGIDLVARYGGEEFAVVCFDLSTSDAQALAQRLVQRLADLRIPHPATELGYLTVSVGWVSLGPEECPQAIAGLKAADQALYAAKKAGRNRAVLGHLPACA